MTYVEYSCFQVLVWKTNFDKSDYGDVLLSHKARLHGEPAPPTIEHIPPRSVQAAPSKAISSAVRHVYRSYECVGSDLSYLPFLVTVTMTMDGKRRCPSVTSNTFFQ